MFDLHQHKTQALYFQSSYERLKERIHHAAPDLDVAVIDDVGKIFHQGKEVAAEKLHPDYFWIHSELFKSPILKDYFRLIGEYHQAKWLHTINTGLDIGPYQDLLHKNIRITNNHSQAIAIAEYVMAHVLNRFQQLSVYREKQSNHTWQYKSFREIQHTHWVIVGFGHIGQQIARRAKPFGVKLTAVRRGKSDEGLADNVTTQDEMMPYLQEADVVILACASNDSTRDMVNKDFLGNMKEGSVLVNVARGDLVVEEDLKSALDAECPTHAILDVFRNEPLPEDTWFWDHPAVTMTPHCSNGGSGMRARSDDLFIENLFRISNGQLLLNEVSERDIA